MRKTQYPVLPASHGAICGAVALTVLGISLAATPAARANTHHLPTGPDAFLNYQVDSTAELEAALRANPAALNRYSRHFGVSPQRFLTFVHNALVTYRLPASQTVTVYGVTRAGHIYAVHERLRGGTRVWATRSGQPILKWACANPLTNRLPGTELARAPRTVRPPHSSGASRVASSNELAPTAVAEAASPETPAEAFSLETPSAAAETGLTVPAPLLSAAVSNSLPAAVVSAGGGSGGGFLIPIGLLLGTTLGHGGGSGGVTTVPLPAELPPVNAPEPGTLPLAAAGALVPLAGLFGRRVLSRRRAG